MCLRAIIKPKNWLYLLLWGCYSILGSTCVIQVIKYVLSVLNLFTVSFWVLMLFFFYSFFCLLRGGMAKFYFWTNFTPHHFILLRSIFIRVWFKKDPFFIDLDKSHGLTLAIKTHLPLQLGKGGYMILHFGYCKIWGNISPLF